MARRSSTAQRERKAVATRRNIGRPTSLTPRTEETILGHLIQGTSIEAACNLAGINSATFRRWMNRGEQAQEMLDDNGTIPEEEERFRTFRASVLDARAQAEVRAVGVVMKAMHGGFVTSEEPLLDLDGQPLRDDDGRILYKRTYTAPDGRLALAYLQRARPKDWSTRADVNVNAQVEMSGPGGGPIQVETTQVVALSERLAAVREQYAIEEREDADSDVIEGEVVEDD